LTGLTGFPGLTGLARAMSRIGVDCLIERRSQLTSPFGSCESSCLNPVNPGNPVNPVLFLI
jgi:hypothetical protein